MRKVSNLMTSRSKNFIGNGYICYIAFNLNKILILYFQLQEEMQMKNFIKPMAPFLAGTTAMRLFSNLFSAQKNKQTPPLPEDPSFIKNQVTKSHCLHPNLFFDGRYKEAKPYSLFSVELIKECKRLAEQEKKDTSNSVAP